jgi:hypothetical protein
MIEAEYERLSYVLSTEGNFDEAYFKNGTGAGQVNTGSFTSEIIVHVPTLIEPVTDPRDPRVEETDMDNAATMLGKQDYSLSNHHVKLHDIPFITGYELNEFRELLLVPHNRHI